MMSLNICFLGALDCKGQACGVSKVTRTLMGMFKAHGHRASALTHQRPEGDVSHYLEEGFVFLPDSSALTAPANIAFVQEYCLKNKIDVIINQENRKALEETFAPLRAQGVKVVSCVHNDPEVALKELKDKIDGTAFAKNPIVRWFYLWVSGLKYPKKYAQKLKQNQREMRSVAQNSDRVVLLSDGFKEAFKKMSGEDSPKVCAIPNPLQDIETAVANRSKRILWIGRMRYKQKRPDRMIQIWEQVAPRFPDWELLILGDGDAKKDLEKYVARKQIKNIRFLGNVESQKYYPTAEILCSTSTVEGFGMVLVEALANGVVPMAFDAFPPAHEIIHQNENGLLVTPYAIEEYVEKLQRLMADGKERNRLRKDSANTLSWMTQEVVYGKWEKLFEEMMKETKG